MSCGEAGMFQERACACVSVCKSAPQCLSPPESISQMGKLRLRGRYGIGLNKLDQVGTRSQIS